MKGSLVVLTGASGSGKTTVARHINSSHGSCVHVACFDSIGVPSADSMIREYESGEAWQRAMTLIWAEKIAAIRATGQSVLFEGQMRIAFVLEAIAICKLEEGRVILLDCDDPTRANRLHRDRGQPELADETMMKWAAYLRAEAVKYQCEVLDSGHLTFIECVRLIEERLALA